MDTHIPDEHLRRVSISQTNIRVPYRYPRWLSTSWMEIHLLNPRWILQMNLKSEMDRPPLDIHVSSRCPYGISQHFRWMEGPRWESRMDAFISVGACATVWTSKPGGYVTALLEYICPQQHVESACPTLAYKMPFQYTYLCTPMMTIYV